MAPSIHSLEPVPIVDINLATATVLHLPIPQRVAVCRSDTRGGTPAGDRTARGGTSRAHRATAYASVPYCSARDAHAPRVPWRGASRAQASLAPDRTPISGAHARAHNTHDPNSAAFAASFELTTYAQLPVLPREHADAAALHRTRGKGRVVYKQRGRIASVLCAVASQFATEDASYVVGRANAGECLTYPYVWSVFTYTYVCAARSNAFLVSLRCYM